MSTRATTNAPAKVQATPQRGGMCGRHSRPFAGAGPGAARIGSAQRTDREDSVRTPSLGGTTGPLLSLEQQPVVATQIHLGEKPTLLTADWAPAAHLGGERSVRHPLPHPTPHAVPLRVHPSHASMGSPASRLRAAGDCGPGTEDYRGAHQ